jgi:signal peptidase I
MEDYSITPVTAEVPPSAKSSRRRFFAVVLSLILPGTGQLCLGKRRTGIVCIFLCFLLALLYWLLRLPTSFVGLQASIFAAMGLWAASAWHTLRTSIQDNARGSRWWLVLLLPIACITSLEHGRWLLPVAGIRAFDIPSTGMEPTVRRGDRVMVDCRQSRGSKPKPNDIVVFQKDGIFFIKRVIAVGGDTIEGVHNAIFVNGQRLNEPYIQHLGTAPPELSEFGPLEVRRGELFVIGDNRDVSLDSRTAQYGPVPEGTVIGNALYAIRLLSWRKIGIDLH